MTFDEVRARFPVLDRLAYLNAGTFGPLSRVTSAAMAEEERRNVEEGRGGRRYFEGMLETRERVRAAIGEQVGVGPELVALTTSTTDGCNLVVHALGLGPDDEVVTTDSEHFGLIGPLAAAGVRFRVARIAGRPAADAFDVIRAEVTSRTRLLALSHVLWTTGHVLPIAELREATGQPVLADGAQSAGAIPVRADAVDWYTVSAQKWLCGPDATGALVVRDPAALPVRSPSYFSQESYDLVEPRFAPKAGAARFDTGWLPTPALAGLDAALADLPGWRFEHARAAAGRCRERLAEAGFELATDPDQGTLVSFRVDGDPVEAAARCFEQGVILRDMPGTDRLRVSCGYWTSDEDVERLIAALRT
ncbi:MAG TPA: aminotransferase class V-fold PLP-dependent enzyme [Gaiellaceae bacterium]|jgi:L-cysteine/cystine lyase|nr:aminotransferase class V-fold PLP-dependent enzyme [Gaiellaceae bacterium]